MEIVDSCHSTIQIEVDWYFDYVYCCIKLATSFFLLIMVESESTMEMQNKLRAQLYPNDNYPKQLFREEHLIYRGKYSK